MEEIIRIKDLKKQFGKNKVLKGIDFDLKASERVVVLGPSGSGKSTFLRCINRMEEPTVSTGWKSRPQEKFILETH